MDRRRYLMMQNDKPKIITDGLVFHLDGKNKGADIDNGYWTDLAQGIKFKLEDCIINSDNVEFNGVSSYGWNSENSEQLSHDFRTSTIEVCYMYSKEYHFQVGLYLIKINQPNSIGLVYAFKYITSVVSRELEGASIMANLTFPNVNYSISMNSERCLLNRKSQTLSKWAAFNSTETTTCYIGVNFKNNMLTNYLEGKIYSIRIYNRLLSEEEMLHNQQCDIDNYFGGHIE